MSKIIFSDYDGTLDTSENDIAKNIEAIKKFRDKGNLFVIATGRSYLDLKRKLDLFRLLLAAFIGSLTVLFLFTSITSITLFFLKLVISIVMLLIAFGYKTLNYTIKNIIYLYLLSIVLGGCLYLVNISVSYKREGLIFINNGLSTSHLW